MSNAEIKPSSKFPTATVLSIAGTLATAAISYYFTTKSDNAKLPKQFLSFVNFFKPSKSKNSILKYTSLSVGLFFVFKYFTRKTKIEYKYQYTLPSKDEYAEYEEKQEYYTSEPNKEKPIMLSKKGLASMKPQRLFEYFETFKNSKKNIFGKEYMINNKLEWKFTTRGEYYNQVYAAARSFIYLGLKPWESVCIIGFNAPEWSISDIGAIYAGGLAVGMYTTNNSGQIEYICNNCKCRVLVVENNKQLDKIIPILDKLKTVTAIIIYDDIISDDIQTKGKKLLTFDKFINLVPKDDETKYNTEIKERIANIKPGHCATLVYTSGTTGNPKGTMISHDSIVFDIFSLTSICKHVNWSQTRLISYLPLSHIAGKLCDIYAPIIINGNPNYDNPNFVIYYARKDALKGSLPDTMRYVKPTAFLGVPRVWEKIEETMKKVGKNGGFITKTLGSMAKSVGLKYHFNKLISGNKQIPFGFGLFNKIVFSNIKKKLGLDECELMVTAAAPIKKATIEYFGSLNIHITQVYGLSESCGSTTVGLSYHDDRGSVGISVPGCEILIDHKDGRDKPNEGEILIRGRNIMSGYIYNINKSKESIDENGYFHSGDVGKVDNNTGLVYITGRIKELIITAGGENIAPIPIEEYLRTKLTGLSSVILIGDKKKYLTILITLKIKQNKDTQQFTGELINEALEVDPNCKTVTDAKTSTKWKEYITNGINEYNNNENVCVSRAQRIQYYTILDSDFSVETGELTDSLKLKRSVIATKFKNEIESMYNH